MIRSMTGFGTAEGPVGASRVSVELRSVNHRFFNPSIKLPGALAKWEPDVREALRKSVSRGHITLFARIEKADEPQAATIDEAKFSAYVKRLMDLKDRFALDGPLDLGTVLRMPDVVRVEQEDDEGSAAELVAIVEAAALALNGSREAEGRRLQGFLLDRVATIEAAVARLKARAPQRILEHRERLKANVAELAGGVAVDEQRLALEIAILADRLDVGEEMDRFDTHLASFRDTLGRGAREGVGKRLGFLLQELLREANTTGSKSNDAEMTRDVLAIKEELERIREQVENLE